MTYRDPFYYARCPRCKVRAGRWCRALQANSTGVAGRRIRKLHPERPRAAWAPPVLRGRRLDVDLAERRLHVWQYRATLGDPVDDIAAELGVSRAALDRFVLRARRNGHPKAVYHALARVT